MTTHANPRSISILRTLIIVGVMLGSLLTPLAFRAASAPQVDTGVSGGGSTNEDAVYRLFNEYLSGGNDVAVSAFVADSALLHTPRGEFPGIAGYDAFFASLRAPFSNTTFVID